MFSYCTITVLKKRESTEGGKAKIKSMTKTKQHYVGERRRRMFFALAENENVSKLQRRCRAGNLKRTNIKKKGTKTKKKCYASKTCFDNYKWNQDASICSNGCRRARVCVFYYDTEPPALAKDARCDWLDVASTRSGLVCCLYAPQSEKCTW